MRRVVEEPQHSELVLLYCNQFVMEMFEGVLLVSHEIPVVTTVHYPQLRTHVPLSPVNGDDGP